MIESATCQASEPTTDVLVEAPCTFQYILQFSTANGFAVGDRIVLSLEWVESGKTHRMYSPPLQIATALSQPTPLPGTPPTVEGETTTAVPDARRLNGGWRKQRFDPRRLWSVDDWNQRLTAVHKDCD